MANFNSRAAWNQILLTNDQLSKVDGHCYPAHVLQARLCAQE